MFALCDEAYALITALDEQALSSRRILWTQFGLHLSWVAGATAGGLAGASFLSGLKGLDFVLIAMFLVLTIDTYRSRPDRRGAALAVTAALVALVLVPGAMVLVAMCGYTVTLVARHYVTRVPTRGRRPPMPELAYIAAALSSAVAITFALRALPFAARSAIKNNELAINLGRWMPLGATVILAVYCLSTIDFTAPAHGTGPILGAAVTVGMHLWRRNAVLSIVVGTAACLLVTNLT